MMGPKRAIKDMIPGYTAFTLMTFSSIDFFKVFFTRGSHYNTRLKLYIREDGNGFIPKDFANVQNGNSFV